MTDSDFWADIEPAEDRYGGGYRTRHVILMRGQATLSFSAYSCRLGDKVAPNRDYATEGLCAFTEGERWKFIDAFGVGLTADGAVGKLTPGMVRACPWECDFSYGDGERTLYVSYYLYDVGHGGAGVIKARLSGPAQGAAILFEPFFDIRPSGGEGDVMMAEVIDGGLAVSSGDRTACVRLNGGRMREPGHSVEWKYKLGLGERSRDGERISPVPLKRKIRSFCELETPGNSAELRFSCGSSREEALGLLENREVPGRDLARARAVTSALFPGYSGTGFERAVTWRALGMARFRAGDGVRACGLLSGKVLPRDQFEGLLQNFYTIKKAYGTGCIKDVLLKSYERQDEWGRCAGEPEATLIAFILAGLTVRETNDGDLAAGSADAFRKYLAGVRACHLSPGGPPMLKPSGLVSVGPALAWMGGAYEVDGHKVPERVGPAWARELIGRNAVGELELQKYLLPEVNARWIRCLEAGWLFSKYVRDFRLADRCRMIYYKALGSYKDTFYNPQAGFLYNMVATDESSLGKRHDPAVTSTGVAAAAILGTDAFTLRELAAIAQTAKERLLRKKWDKPFGVAVMDGAGCAYLDREKAYGGAVCPGDTPYLVRLLRMTGDAEMANSVLEANLRHQMEEGFVFYNNEIFSCDHGLVPSGEPVRWWSQWVDPYLEV